MPIETAADRLFGLLGANAEVDLADLLEEIGRTRKRLAALEQLRDLLAVAVELAPGGAPPPIATAPLPTFADDGPRERADGRPKRREGKSTVPPPEEAGPAPTTSDDERRRLIVRHVAAHGPAHVKAIATYFRWGVEKTWSIVKHPWFEREPDGIHVTAEARAAVLEGERDDP